VANFTAGTSFTDGVTNDVTAAKLNALVADAVPTSNLALASTTGTISNFTASTANITLGTIPTLTAGTTTGTAGIFTSGTITNLSATTSTFLGAITASTSVINVGSGQIYKDSSGNVGVGTASPSQLLHISKTGGAQIRVDSGASNVVSAIGSSGAAGYVGTTSNDSFQILTNNTERLRIDSSGFVGIGTTNPLNKLHVKHSSAGAMVLESSASDQVQITFRGTTGDRWAVGNNAATGGTGLNFDIYDYSASANRLRIDSSGNVGIGETSPSYKMEIVSSTSYRALMLKEPSALANIGSNIRFQTKNGSGNYWDCGTISVRNNSSNMTAGSESSYMSFFTASSGTEAERLRIDSSGKVGVGVSNPAARLHVDQENPANGITSIFRNTSSASQTGSQIQITQNGIEDWAIGQPAGTSAFSVWSGRNAATTGTERLRIDSSGNLLVGTTSIGPTNANYITAEVSSKMLRIGHSGTANSSPYIAFDYNGIRTGWIEQDTTSSVKYNTSSDYRLKEDIAPISSAMNRITSLNPVTFTWKSDGNHGEGFIAHELMEIIPNAVSGEKDAVDSDGKPIYQGIDQSKIVPLLTAALKEAIAKIETLEAKVTALEAA